MICDLFAYIHNFYGQDTLLNSNDKEEVRINSYFGDKVTYLSVIQTEEKRSFFSITICFIL